MFLRPTADVKQSVESAVLPDLMKNCKKRNLSAWTFKLSYIVLIFYLIYFLDPEIQIMQKTNIWVVTWPSSHGHCLTLSKLNCKTCKPAVKCNKWCKNYVQSQIHLRKTMTDRCRTDTLNLTFSYWLKNVVYTVVC